MATSEFSLRQDNHVLQTMNDSKAREIARLKAEIKELKQCCTQRGARMQLMQEWLDKFGLWDVHHKDYPNQAFLTQHAEAAEWFDEDWVPK